MPHSETFEQQWLSVTETAKVLRIGRNEAYQLIARGDFPVPVIKVGRQYRISRYELDRLAGKPTTGDMS